MKTFLQILILSFSLSVSGQATQNIGYQAVVRNAANQLVQNQNIKIKVSLMTGATGIPFYVETHTTQTNTNGLFNIQIGGGTAETGNYTNAIYWAGGNHFVKTEIDPLGGSNYSITSTTQLLSVPYANHAVTAGVLLGGSNNFVGFYKQINASNPNNPWIVAISYASSDKFLCQIQGYYTNGSGIDSRFSDLVYGKEIRITSSGYEAKLIGLETEYIDIYLNSKIEINGTGILTITDEDDEVYKFQRID